MNQSKIPQLHSLGGSSAWELSPADQRVTDVYLHRPLITLNADAVYDCALANLQSIVIGMSVCLSARIT